MRTAIRNHLRDFVAILGLLVIAGVVSVVILENQRLTAPAWVPIFGTDFYEIEAEFANAQAVTPGQGQSVTVAGINVGEISSVRLEDGKAIVGLSIEDPDIEVYRDATALLRPKTGLKDMVVQLEPGTAEAGRIPEGGRLGVGATKPDVNLDEVLAVLDTDTRTWLRVLVNDGERGLRGRGDELAEVFGRFEPLNRDLRAINEELAERKDHIRRAIHNFSLLAGELGESDEQISDFVDSSNAVLAVFSEQEANLRATLRELPGSLGATRRALTAAEELGDEMGPSLESLRPAARALGPALRDVRPFLRETVPIIREDIRPLVRETRPAVRLLRPTLRDLSAATPDLLSTFRTLNRAFNMIAHNPPGVEEGYLFWFAWVNHLGPAVFPIADAHGPIRRGLFVASCNALDLVDNVAQANPQLGVIIELLNPVRDSSICPSLSGSGSTPGATPSPSLPGLPTPPVGREGGDG